MNVIRLALEGSVCTRCGSAEVINTNNTLSSYVILNNATLVAGYEPRKCELVD